MRWTPRLFRLLEGGLAPDERRRVEAALDRSARLRRDRDALARGRAAAEMLRGAEGLDDARAAAIETALRSASGRTRGGGGRAALAAAAAVLVAVGVAALLAWDPGLRLVRGAGAATPLEATALALFDRLEAGDLALDLETASPGAARRFLRRRTGLDARLVERPAGGEAERFEVTGVTLTEVAGAPAAGVAFRIGEEPALLLTARAGAVPGGQAHWSPLDRELRVSRAGARRVLSWANSGQSYVLVSELPGHGQASCGACHAGPERSRMVESAAASLVL